MNARMNKPSRRSPDSLERATKSVAEILRFEFGQRLFNIFTLEFETAGRAIYSTTMETYQHWATPPHNAHIHAADLAARTFKRIEMKLTKKSLLDLLRFLQATQI